MSLDRPYSVTISRFGKSTSGTILAPSWAEAWAQAAERYGDEYSIKVSQYYQVLSDGERSIIVDEVWYWKVMREGKWTPRSEWIPAQSWIAAKARLGFELSADQKERLAREAA